MARIDLLGAAFLLTIFLVLGPLSQSARHDISLIFTMPIVVVGCFLGLIFRFPSEKTPACSPGAKWLLSALTCLAIASICRPTGLAYLAALLASPILLFGVNWLVNAMNRLGD